jgi:hypothetical protein
MSKTSILIRSAAAVAVAASVAAPALARDYYYFNKPGVSRDAYVADISECTELAGGAKPASTPTPVYVPPGQYNYIAVPIAMLFWGLLHHGDDEKLQRFVERTCMADKGYARMEVEKPIVRQIELIEDEGERIDRLFALAASEKPIGTRMSE